MARNISSRLVSALKAVDRPGAFCADGGGPARYPVWRSQASGRSARR